MNESTQCEYCGLINTTYRDDEGKPRCASCTNEQYASDLLTGKRVEFKIDMRKVKQSTLMQIQALIRKDIEEYENKYNG
jgi:hypothetical protein